MAICAGLLGFDGSMQLADPVNDVGVHLDEVGSGLFPIFEFADLRSEPGPLVLEKPSVRFGCLLPGTFGCLQRGGAGVEVLTAAVPGEEPTVGVLGSAEVLRLDSPGCLKARVTIPNGRVGPPSGASPKIGEVLFEGISSLVDLSKPVGDGRRDAADELAVLGAQDLEAFDGSGLVGDPLLATLVVPGPGEALRSLGEVRSGGVDVARAPGAAHGYVSELSAAAVVEDMGHFDRGALRAMSSDRVAVAETVRADVFGSHVKLAAIGGDRGQGLGLRIDGGDLGGL